MKTFSATIESTSLEKAIDLTGYSHAGPEFEKDVLWYPFKATMRKIYFSARNRTEAIRKCDQIGLLVRDLTD